MRYGPQDDLAELVSFDPRAEGRAEEPLDHRVHRLHLPSLTILALQPCEPLLHHPPPSPRRRLVRRSAPRRWDDRPDAVRAGADMNPFGVEVGIGQEGLDPRAADCLTEGLAELHQVAGRPPPRDRREDQVAVAVDHEDDLGVVRVSPVPIGIPVGLPLGVVAADVSRLHPRAVDGRQADPPLPHPMLQGLLVHGVEHATAGHGRQESLRRLLEGGEVGDGLQGDQAAEVGMVGEVLAQPAVVEARELLEHQAGQELRLGELLGAELVSVRGHSPTGRLVGDLEHPARRFAGLHTS